MSDLRTVIAAVEDYCNRTGLSEATVCNRATGNAYLLDRMRRRAERIETDREKLLSYIAENPPARVSAGDAA